MVIVISDENGKALREIADFDFETAFGDDENTISIEADSSAMPTEGGYAFIDGTEYGGTIDKIKASTSRSNGRSLTAKGRSWHGILAGKRLVPDPDRSHIVVSGQIATVLQALIERMGLSDLFEAPASESDNRDISDYEFERFVDGYTGIKAMCTAHNMKLKMRFVEGKVLIGACDVVDYGSKVDSDLIDFDLERISRRTNHLICGGTGENENRAIIHFYADENGVVSKTQSLFGVDEIAAFYDYSNADEEKLEEDGKKKLEEMQGQGTVEVDVHDDLDIDVGDIVSARDNVNGITVSAAITKKIVKISRGVATYEYEAGTPSSGTSASTISGSAESTNGGHAYYAGNGLTLDNYTFNADVNSDDLQVVENHADSAYTLASNASAAAAKAQQTADTKAEFEHHHDASDIATGIVPIEHGGTGAATAGYALSNLSKNLSKSTNMISDGTGLPTYAVSSGIGGFQVFSDVWNYIQSKINANVEPADIGAAPEAQAVPTGGTEGQLLTKTADAFGWADKPSYTASEVGAAEENHTHNYAGSSVAGGAATSAEKLTTARKITIDGTVKGSASFDGSKDITITVEGDTEAAGFLAAHPVGSIYQSSKGDNPGTLYSGTWKALPSVGAYTWERTA